MASLALALAVPVGMAPVASAQSGGLGRPDLPEQRVSKVDEVTGQGAQAARARVAKDRKTNAAQAERASEEQQATWPAPGTAKVTLAATGMAEAKPGGLPLTVAASRAKSSVPGTTEVQVTTLDRKAADSLGITGVVLTAQADRKSRAEIGVDYSSFASAVGGGWSGRLRLVRLPDCALTTPEKAECRTQTPLDSNNDAKNRTVAAQVTLAGTSTGLRSASGAQVLALTAAAAGAGASAKGTGNYGATGLSESSSWQAGASSGTFNWSYGFSVPPAAAGPSPSLALSYDSGSVDGRTATTNNQGTSVGEGFSMTESYVERSYGSCDDDGHDDVSEQCWKYDNARLVLNGVSSRLVKDDTSGRWRLEGDDASQVTRTTGADNGDNDGEYWTVVKSDGTSYVFGLDKLDGAGTQRTNSTWTVPVYGDDSGEPGYDKGSSFEDRPVTQAWRWNLDYVVDTHNNAATYWYAKEANYYKKSGATTAGTAYTRGGYLREITYGLRKGALFTDDADAKVTLDYAERCTASDCSTLDEDTSDNWPDVPFDAICAKDADDCLPEGPAFFSRKRLTGLNTFSWSAATGKYAPVDRWDFTQEYLDGGDIGDTSDQVLTLKSIKRTGLTGTATTLEPVSFTYQMRPNRVDGTDDILPLTRPRMSTITSETGSITTVTLSSAECTRSQVVGSREDANTRSCYPQYWDINGGSDASVDWFQKYRVLAVSVSDPAGQNDTVENEYVYSGAAWHYNDEPFTPADERTWSDWRGYRQVTVYRGALDVTRSKTVSVYLQGMDGDKQKDGTTRSVTVSALTSPALGIPVLKDTGQYAGQLRQSVTYDGATAISATMNVPWSKETARQSVPGAGDHVARYVRTAASTNYTYLTVPKTWRSTGTTSSFDDYGMATTASDLGDLAKSGDEICTRYWYARNDAVGLTGLVSRTRTVAKACSVTETALKLPSNSDTRADVVSDIATVYDTATVTGWTPGQKPTQGSATWTGRVTGYPAAETGGERNPTGWQKITTTTYDTLGRPRTVTDIQDHVSGTAYTPVDAGPLTKTVLTNAKLHTAAAFLDPRRGLPERSYDANQKLTEQSYDALGRLTAVWAPNRIRGSQSPTSTFAYHLSRTEPSSVASSTLKADGETYQTSYAVYDALLRPLQTQSPTPLGGRLLTDTRYDSRGLAYETYSDIFDDTTPPEGVYTRAEYGEAPKQSETVYDGAGRATANTLYLFGVKKWTTSTSYTGDSTATTALEGGSATRAIADARGQVVETREYAGRNPDDAAYGSTLGVPYTSIATTYTADGLKDTITSAQDGAQWRYTYDLFGRQVSETDPDMGRSTTAYDNLDQIVKVTDARGAAVLTGYDKLGRVESTWAGEKTEANLLTSREYDTLAKGQPTSSTRYVGGLSGQRYVKAITAYDNLYHATGTRITLPDSDPLVKAGVPVTLDFASDYRIDGTPLSATEPAVGGLAAETVEYGYNGLGRTTSVTGATGYLQAVDYSALGQVQQLVLGTGGEGAKNVYVTHTYEEGTGRLTRSHVTDQTHSYMLQDLHYTQDDAGNLTSISDEATLGASGATDYQCFVYDAHQRLTDAWTPKTADCATTGRTTAGIGGAAPYWTSYTYTAAGQRDTETTHATSVNPSTTETAYEYGTVTGQTHPLSKTTGAKAATYSYDNSGNTTGRPGVQATQTLVWDTEGNLGRTTEPAVGSKPALDTGYLYDADGELLIRRAAGDGDTVLYLGASEVRLTTKAATKTLSGTRYYSAAGQTLAVRTATAGTAGSKLCFLTADHHGTSNVTIDAGTQAVKKRYSTPFGASRGAVPAAVWPDDKTFLGKPSDVTTGLTHIGAREYDTGTGQFLSVDPLLSVEQHQSLNGYTYANQNPTTNSDPTGLACYGGNHSAECNPTGQGGDAGTGCYAGNMSPSCEAITGNNMGTDDSSVSSSGSGATTSTSIGGTSGSGTSLTYVAGPKDIPVCFACMIGVPPVIGPVVPEVSMQNYCGSVPLDLACNPEDAVTGGGSDTMPELFGKWVLGDLEMDTVYGEDSEIAQEVMWSDETFKQREIIRSMYYSLGVTAGTLKHSIDPDNVIGTAIDDLGKIATQNKNAITAELGSYTMHYKVLRASDRGIQVRMTIKNSMTVSSFLHEVPGAGYGSVTEKFLKRWVDNDGIIAAGNAAKYHDMEVTFRIIILRNGAGGYRGLGG